MRGTSRKLWRLAAATVAVALIAACTTSDSTAPQNPVLTQPEANSVAEVVATDAASLAGAASPNFVSGIPFAVAPMPGAPALAPSSASCTPTRSPSTVTNSDGDPVPDTVNINFTGCTFSGNGNTITLSGSIDIVDPTPKTTDQSFRTRSHDFTRSVTNSTTGTTRSVVENGVRSVTGTADQIQLYDTTTTAFTFATNATATHDRKWLATFTAEQPGSIQLGAALPTGQLSINGSSTFTSPNNTYSLSVSTTPALHYNASCTVQPRFDTGTLTAKVTKGTAATTVTITFTGCGQYSVVRS